MAITVYDLESAAGEAQREMEVLSVESGSEPIFLVPKNARITIQCNGTGEITLMTSLAKYKQIREDADFTKFVEDLSAPKNSSFIASTVGEGITAVAPKVTSGTWDIRIVVLRNSIMYK